MIESRTKTMKTQAGAALIVSLILLVVVTVLAITGMNTATTELAMARNDQNYENAFQAAETGLNQAFADNLAYDISGTYTGGAAPQTFAGSADSASYMPTFLGFSPPPPGSLYSATSFQAAHFNFRATGTSATNLSIILNGGAYQIAPKM